MRIGELRKQIAIQEEVPTPDDAGGYALTWTTVATMWGDISPLNGNEIYTAQHLEGHVTHRITLRYRSDIAITSNMRAVYNNRTFNIRSIFNTDERNQWQELLAEEGGAV
jgi:SPP1 family predicted phage head-tail adaptor